MSGHTPGPWIACGEDRGGCECGHVWSVTADAPVATVERGVWGDCYPVIKDGSAVMETVEYGVVPEPEAAANARLIAAAPDLLEALVDTLDSYVSLVECGDCGSWDPEQEDHVRKARAAIAKATGGDA